MPLLAGITFRKIGKLHYYSADDLPESLAVGDRVVAETERGDDCGEVKILREVTGSAQDNEKIYRLLRRATENDTRTAEKRLQQAIDGLEVCRKKSEGLLLPMKVTDAEVTFDGQQTTFYFVADARIDFRQLVKEVAAVIKMRVHLHQVGSRDHAQALGGYGPCGRPLCCTTFLRDFAPVSMKMAKDQSLYLNPSKFSGVCGKLMCCLRYEHEVYVEAKEKMPQLGMTVTTPTGERGVVTEVNIFAEKATVLIRTEEETRSVVLPAKDIRPARACGDCGSAGGGCGGSCGSDTCETSAKGKPAAPAFISLEHRFNTPRILPRS